MTPKINIGGKEYTAEEVAALAKAGVLNVGQKNDLLDTNYQLQAAHGFWSDGSTAGLFSRPGQEPDVFSAIRYPEAAFVASLFAGVTDSKETEYTILTGAAALAGDNASADAWCADPPRAGVVRAGTTRAQFGQMSMATNSVKLAEIGGRVNRADVDLNLVNSMTQNPLVPDFMTGLMGGGNPINTALGLEMFSLSQQIIRSVARVAFEGSLSTTGTNAEPGFMKEFDGFDSLIKTGYTDLETGTTMPAADSIVVDFAEDDVSDGASDIVEQMSNIMFRLIDRSSQNNFGDMWDGVIAMNPNLFHALTEIWPCDYLTYGCYVTNNSGERVNIDGAAQIRMRDEMRSSKTLPILGRRVPVVTTHAIVNAESGAGFASDIYFIPLRAGGRRVTYLEAFDMGRQDVAAWQQLLPAGQIRVTNGGVYLASFNIQNACAEYILQSQMRLVMRTPWLAARIYDVGFNLPGYANSPYPGDTDAYYVAGGKYYSKAPYTAT